MSDKIFLLGVGCQKGGTTWLRRQLKKQPSIDLGFAQEYHVFDALEIDSCTWFRAQKVDQLKKLHASRDQMHEVPKLLQHIDFYRDTKNYFDYFDQLFNLSEDTRIVGDITPSYCGLRRETFKHMRNELEIRNFTVKVIFLMRDPIERCWSQLRMARKNLVRYRYPDEQDALWKNYKSTEYEFRTRYELTIANLESAFSTDDIFFGFYEKLFELDTIKKLGKFLDLSDFMTSFQEKVNVSPKTTYTQLNDELSRNIVDFYRDTYLYCDKKFGVKDIWGGFKYL